ACFHLVAATVLIAVALVPAIARAHDRFDHQRTPQQEHSRFRWANSCAAVPQKATTFVVVVPAEGPAQTLVDFPLRLAHRAPAAAARAGRRRSLARLVPARDRVRVQSTASPPGLRAPFEVFIGPAFSRSM